MVNKKKIKKIKFCNPIRILLLSCFIQFFSINLVNSDEQPVSYSRDQLINLTRESTLPEEKFVFECQKFPLEAYSMFNKNQFDVSYNNEIIIKIIADINSRLNSGILDSEKFENYKESLQNNREYGINLLCQAPLSSINPTDLNVFVLNYLETMYELIKSQDSSIQGTYYTDFAKDFIKNLSGPGNNTQMFYTFKELDEQYFIDVRPLCFYPVYLMTLPDFSSENPLIPTQDVKGYVESKSLDFREVSYHDIGHAYVMNRQDKWLFETSNRSPKELTLEWLRNKDWYMDECNKISDTNNPLYKAIKLILFDITHDRGYQFYLPILKQQFKALKNLENLKTRILRGEFDNSYDRNIIDHLDEAREWLLDVTDQFLVKDNIDKIERYKKEGFTVKKYLDIESCAGIPINVVVSKNGKILVDFDSNGIIKTTSLYEIELIGLPVEDVILNDEKIEKINEWRNALQTSDIEFIQLDHDANVLNPIENQIYINEKIHEFNLKKIEIYKLERLLQLIRKNKSVKFSISKLPDIYNSNRIFVDQQSGSITIDNGLLLNLNEISIEPN